MTLTDCFANTLLNHIRRLYMAFVVGAAIFTAFSMLFVVLFVHYGNAMRDTSLMESFLIQAKDSDTHMRLMASDIRHRAVALQIRLEERDDALTVSELQHIIMVADRVTEYPYFWVKRQENGS